MRHNKVLRFPVLVRGGGSVVCVHDRRCWPGLLAVVSVQVGQWLTVATHKGLEWFWPPINKWPAKAAPEAHAKAQPSELQPKRARLVHTAQNLCSREQSTGN